MGSAYIGRLSESDPFYHYLRYDITPQMAGNAGHTQYRVFQLNGSNDVYMYEDVSSGARVVGKFFLSDRNRNHARASHLVEKEFHNLHVMRNHGFTAFPHHVVRPLGYNHWTNHALVVEYHDEETLSRIIMAALYRGDRDRLFRKLTALAYFLATLHNRTALDVSVDFNEDCAYLDRLIARLLAINAMKQHDAEEFYWLRDQWRCQGQMWEDRQVQVHGDATPSNFLFGRGLNVIAIDLERFKQADRVFDVGRIAGELKHFFLSATGDRYAAEPFISHFLWEYACHFPDQLRAFHSITKRVPFHMGLTLLRIARNAWVGPEYRWQLITEARNILRRFV
jgi:aminoglycoside phosphotransferase (APT) family kinase protein